MIWTEFSGIDWITFLSATVVGWGAAIFGWVKWFFELRDKRKEKAAKEKAETELRQVRRRATETSPYLVLSDKRFNGLEVPTNDPHQSFWYPAGDPHVLSWARKEIEEVMQPDSLIYLLVENQGSDALEIRVCLDEEPASLEKIKAGDGYVYAIRYGYREEMNGKEQTFEISFLAPNGVRDTHKYRTRHGTRKLVRIDPV